MGSLPYVFTLLEQLDRLGGDIAVPSVVIGATGAVVIPVAVLAAIGLPIRFAARRRAAASVAAQTGSSPPRTSERTIRIGLAALLLAGAAFLVRVVWSPSASVFISHGLLLVGLVALYAFLAGGSAS